MAYTDVIICNMALGHLVQPSNISSIDPPDGSAYSKDCYAFWAIARDIVLQRHDWNFARKRQALTEVDLGTAQPALWQYAFQRPTDVIQIRTLIETGDVDTNGIDFEDEGGYIYCNVADPTLIYTFRQTDLSNASPSFASCLSKLMASYLAGRVAKGSVKLREFWEQKFEEEVSRAAGFNYNKGTEHKDGFDHKPIWETDR